MQGGVGGGGRGLTFLYVYCLVLLLSFVLLLFDPQLLMDRGRRQGESSAFVLVSDGAFVVVVALVVVVVAGVVAVMQCETIILAFVMKNQNVQKKNACGAPF